MTKGCFEVMLIWEVIFMFIDTHAHLFDEYYSNIEEVIARALDNNVLKIIISGCDIKSNLEVLEKVGKYDSLYGTIGIHPLNLDNLDDNYIDFLEENIRNEKIIGIGEIGLDYHYGRDNKELQKDVFIRQIELAIKYNMPIVVHSRDATEDMMNILRRYNGKLRGVMHCYSGSVETALELTKMGFYLGVGGIITFKNAKNIVEVIKKIDLKYILLETDSPYLTPEPYRGSSNEPAYIPLIAGKIAEIKSVSLDDVMIATEGNVKMVFDK